MSSWRELASKALAGSSTELDGAAEGFWSPAAIEVRPALDPAIADKIHELSRRPAPRLRPESQAGWRQVLADAAMLIESGWAERAIGLGWGIDDLFGLSAPDTHDFEGLAVWLRGSTILLLDAEIAIAGDGDRRRYFNRGGFQHGKEAAAQSVLLWQFGRG